MENTISDSPGTLAQPQKREWPMTPLMPVRDPNSENKPTPRMVQLAADVRARINSPLPADYWGLVEEHGWLWRLRQGWKGRVSRETLNLVAERHDLVRKAINALTGSDQRPTVITAQDYGRAHLSGHHVRSQIREQQLSQYRAALTAVEANPLYFENMTIEPKRKIEPHVVWLLTASEGRFAIYGLLNDLRHRLTRYEQIRLENYNLLHPRARVEEIKAECEACRDPVRIKALEDEAATLSTATIEATSTAMHLTIAEEWKNVDQVIKSIGWGCYLELTDARDKWLQHEKTMHGMHPVGIPSPHKPSMYVTAFDSAINQFKNIAEPPPRPPTPVSSQKQEFRGDQTILESVFALPILDKSPAPEIVPDEDHAAAGLAQ